MKNKFIILLVIITIISVSFFTACGEDEEQPKNQSATITNLFGEGFTATVKGNLTDTEWEGVAGKIETALNGAFTSAGLFDKSGFIGVFETNNVVIIVETNPSDYTKWKTSVDGKTLYLAFGTLNNDLQGSISSAVKKMAVLEAGFVQIIDRIKLPNTFFS